AADDPPRLILINDVAPFSIFESDWRLDMRTTLFIAALTAAIFSIPFAAHAADPFPKFDIAKNCKAEVAENSGIGETLESCTRDEQQAMQELMPQWDHYRREDKTV